MPTVPSFAGAGRLHFSACWCCPNYVYAHRSSFSEFAFKYSKDERFKSVEKMREREQLFTDYLAELKKVSKHKEEQKSSKSKEDVVNLESCK